MQENKVKVVRFEPNHIWHEFIFNAFLLNQSSEAVQHIPHIFILLTGHSSLLNKKVG